MYAWYRGADICYAYLADVCSVEIPRIDDSRPPSKDRSFHKSRWFTRGWTLQELIAPLELTFLSAGWEVIGSKHDLADVIEDITGIGDEALLHVKSLDEFPVAQRFPGPYWYLAILRCEIHSRPGCLLGKIC